MNVFANYNNSNKALANSSNSKRPSNINLNKQKINIDEKLKMNDSLVDFSKFASTNSIITVPKSVRFSLATPFSPMETQMEFNKIRSKIKYSVDFNKIGSVNSSVSKSKSIMNNRTSFNFNGLSSKLKLPQKKGRSFYEIMTNHSKQKTKDSNLKKPKDLKKIFSNVENEFSKPKSSILDLDKNKRNSNKIQRLSQDLRNSIYSFENKEDDSVPVSNINTPQLIESPTRFKRNSTKRNSVNVSERMSHILTTELRENANKEAPLPKIKSQFAVTNFFIRNFKVGAHSDIVGSSM